MFAHYENNILLTNFHDEVTCGMGTFFIKLVFEVNWFNNNEFITGFYNFRHYWKFVGKLPTR